MNSAISSTVMGTNEPTRREILLGAGALGLAGAAAGCAPGEAAAKVDYALTIAPVSVEIAPDKIIKTVGYNGTVPGPLMRFREGQQATIAVTNKSDVAELVHWHGLRAPSVLDGTMEEGTPMIEPGKSATYSFTVNPSGTRWYHTHAMAGKDTTRSLYSGQYGFLYVELKNNPGRYDQEIFIAMHQWEAYFNPPGMDIAYKSGSFNDKALGHGEPIRVRQGQRVLFRLLNASARGDIMLALPGHTFTVLTMDGNPVPHPQTVETLMVASAERIDVVVEMNSPGAWVLGSTRDAERDRGLGIVVEYAGATGEPQWQAPKMAMWDYLMFANAAPAAEPDVRVNLLIGKIVDGHDGYNVWTINGKAWPDTDPIMVEKGKRYRLMFNNDTGDMHPMHLHRHNFEVANLAGKPTSGLIKDVVNIPRRAMSELDFVADNPGPSLMHCHMQEHQDFGFMVLVKYA